MGLLNLGALAETPLSTEPFDFIILKSFVAEDGRPAILADFPPIQDAGSFPLSELNIGPGLQALIDEMDGPGFRRIVEQKFGLDLTGAPTMFTLRGRCDASDGRIHTDSKKKIVTVLVYLNDEWASDGGRLRLLRGAHDLTDAVAEVPPEFGSMLMFRRAANSWHGHETYVGPRKVLQMNWVVSDKIAAWEQWRHRLSAAIKRLTRAFSAKHAHAV